MSIAIKHIKHLKHPILYISIMALAGCATPKTPARPSDFVSGLNYEKEQKQIATKKTVEDVENKLKEKFSGKEFYFTAPRTCFGVRTMSALDAKISREQQKVDIQKLPSDERRKAMDEQSKNLSKDVEKEFEKKEFTPFSKLKIEDVKVFIDQFSMRNKGSSFRVKQGDPIEFEWDGKADIYFIATQGAEKFAINYKSSYFKSSLETPVENLLFDSPKVGSERIDCLSKVNLATKYKLSTKDKDAIKKNSYYLGMSEDALVFSVGRPSKINNTTTSAGSSQQWVYPNNKYFYFSGGKLKSWQD